MNFDLTKIKWTSKLSMVDALQAFKLLQDCSTSELATLDALSDEKRRKIIFDSLSEIEERKILPLDAILE
ncbi:MAG: hypothetical protein COU28_00915 [Candidatus Magasanikbacteria bacterium CG10_big_fil_rev_8_21_14_0_10_36_16]|uniref:Uncharacterized protein n=1 Tax=Candidatus Magasanikbacteria bacterium CG10_big_fil_rev_8_21_14_0_10_36_16 TaxID=1974645 RepID=A0A2H0TZC1_9BACT|nr:MAG: hypothetical protein COU28_00915 [Candidatus Magasanikbacteria bacterium CG10_big_fil_rev_8_21_14_0_10_36_16]